MEKVLETRPYTLDDVLRNVLPKGQGYSSLTFYGERNRGIVRFSYSSSLSERNGTRFRQYRRADFTNVDFEKFLEDTFEELDEIDFLLILKKSFTELKLALTNSATEEYSLSFTRSMYSSDVTITLDYQDGDSVTVEKKLGWFTNWNRAFEKVLDDVSGYE